MLQVYKRSFTKKSVIGKVESNCDVALVSIGNLPLITKLDVNIIPLKEDRIEAISVGFTEIANFTKNSEKQQNLLVAEKLSLAIYLAEVTVKQDKSIRKICSFALPRAKLYSRQFLSLSLLQINME